MNRNELSNTKQDGEQVHKNTRVELCNTKIIIKKLQSKIKETI